MFVKKFDFQLFFIHFSFLINTVLFTHFEFDYLLVFFIGRSLGQGTFGKVRLGTHLITGEKVAIKILEKDKIKDQSDVERVTREIHILKIVRHPNVIQLYEVSLIICLQFIIFYHRSSKLLANFSSSWSTLQAESSLTTSLNVKGCKKMKHVALRSKLFLVLIIFIKYAFVTEI